MPDYKFLLKVTSLIVMSDPVPAREWAKLNVTHVLILKSHFYVLLVQYI